MAITILAVGLLVFFGHFLAGFFERTKVPDVLILMLAGILLGPVLHVVGPQDFGRVGSVFSNLALIIILFEGGIHLNVKHLLSAAGNTLTISMGTFAVTALLLALIAEQLLPINFPTALLVGTILGGTSSAVVVPLIRTLKMETIPSTVVFLESALTDVLIIVLALGFMTGLASGATGFAGNESLLLQIGRSFVIAGGIGIVGAFLWSAILDRVRRFPNTVFTTIAYVFILYGLTELLGYSGAISALMFGIAIANLPNIPDKVFGKLFSFRLIAFADQERAFFAEAVFLVKTFFFVFLGVSMSFSDWRAVAAGATLAIAAFAARAPMVRLLAPTTTTQRDAALMSALIPKGLASAVLASLAAERGVPNAAVIQGTIYSAIFFSIVICAVLVVLAERGLLHRGALEPWFRKFSPEPQAATAQTGPTLAIEPVLGSPYLDPTLEDPNVISLDASREETEEGQDEQ